MNKPALVPLPEALASRMALKEFFFEDEVAVVMLPFLKKGVAMDGHKHVYDHTSFVAAGAIELWCGDECRGEFRFPSGFTVKAGEFHRMVALQDNTIVLCIHNTHGFKDEDVQANLIREFAHA